MRKEIARLEEIKLPKVGHWIMVAARNEVTRGVLEWLMTKSKL
jgi:hypothetical protein